MYLFRLKHYTGKELGIITGCNMSQLVFNRIVDSYKDKNPNYNVEGLLKEIQQHDGNAQMAEIIDIQFNSD